MPLTAPAPIRSRLLHALGVVHGFSTRTGGVSEGVYATLNLSAGWDDDAERVQDNRRRFAAAVGYAPARLVTAKQVHGVRLVHAPDEVRPDLRPEADGVIAREPGTAAGVFTADCVPILMTHPPTGLVAAVHAGWRGAAAGIAAAAVRALEAAGARAAELVCAIGPAIGPCCFEVGPEVVAAFAARFPDARLARDGARGKPHIDLPAAVELDLIAAGMSPRSIDPTPACTHCDRERFFSYRRDGRGGQQLSVIVAGPAHPRAPST